MSSKGGKLLTCSVCGGSGTYGGQTTDTPCFACSGTGKQRYVKRRRKQRAKIRPIRMAKLRKDVSMTNRGLDAVIRAIEEHSAQHLELQRRLQKLETHLRLTWVPDAHYDGEYKPL